MHRYRLWNAAAHGSVILSLVFFVLFLLDRFNPSMDFLGSDQSAWLLLLFCLCSLANGVISAVNLYRRDRAQHKRELREHQLTQQTRYKQ